MANSLRVKLKKLCHDGKINQQDLDELLKKLDGHDRELQEQIPKWHLCEEELPKDSKPILIDCTEGVGEGYYKGKGIFHFNRFNANVEDDNVYAWMELPKFEGVE